MSMPEPSDAIIIKKYANRRLYDTGRSSYVTLDDLYIMLKEGLDFAVHDVTSGDNITHQVLIQIVMDQETKNDRKIMSETFLKRLICLYSDQTQDELTQKLETIVI